MTITIETPEEAWYSYVCAVHGDSGGNPENKEARDLSAVAHLRLYMKTVSKNHAESQKMKLVEAQVKQEIGAIADQLAENTIITVSYDG